MVAMAMAMAMVVVGGDGDAAYCTAHVRERRVARYQNVRDDPNRPHVARAPVRFVGHQLVYYQRWDEGQ